MAEYYGNYNVVTYSNRIDIDIPHVSGFNYYRCDVRPANSSTSDYQTDTSSSSWISFSFNASPNTSYVIRVRYSASQSTYASTNYTLWFNSSNETLTVQTESAPSTVSCEVYKVIDDDEDNPIYVSTRTLTVGTSYQPEDHIPSASGYTYDDVWAIIDGRWQHVTGGLTVPSSDFVLLYYYLSPSTSSVYIYATKNGTTQWWPATPYVYNGSTWQQAEPKIYSSGWN